MRHWSTVCLHVLRARRAVLLIALLAGLAVALVAAPAAYALYTSDNYFFISAIGPTFTGGGFYSSSPDGVATDSAGNVYVTTPSSIAKFDATGAWVCTYGGDGSYLMSNSYGVDVDPAGNIYIADSGHNLIAKVAPDSGGVNATSYHHVLVAGRNGGDGTSGAGNGEFNFPIDVAVDGSYLYVADKFNNRIQKFHIVGDALDFVAKWGHNGGDGSSGTGPGEFWQPCGIAADHEGNIFVADYGNRRIQELHTDGTFETMWGVNTPTSDPLYLDAPIGIDADAHGNVYVADFDSTTSWVNKYAPVGDTYQLVIRFGGWGTADAQFKFPWGVAVDPNGYLYVADTQNLRLKKFARDATPPVVTVSGVPAGWTKTNVTVGLNATDPTVVGQYTSGFDYINYSLTGGLPSIFYAPPLTISTSGDTAVTYRATDMVGNWSTQAAVHVRIDKVKPVTKALANATVKKGHTATLKYRVTDAPTPQVKVSVRIYKGTKKVKTLDLGLQSTGTNLTCSWHCTLAKGTYTWKVLATDLAGNTQVTPLTAKKLTVK